MLCQICGKRQGIPTKITINGVTSVKYICKECQAKSFLNIANVANDFFGSGLLNDFLGGLNGLDSYSVRNEVYRCPHCGTTSTDLLNKGLVGCAECYKALGGVMDEVINNCQGTNTHIGKAPDGRVNRNKEYEDLRKELDRAVAEENYVLAAQLKERLNKLKGGVA